jgi:hypothetical protein
MRDILNLQALKHSKNKKHNTIYEKAHRIMSKGWETKELSDNEIMEIASQFPQLDVRVMIGGDVIVKSKKDTWLIRDEVRFLTLYHRGLVFEKGKTKEKYHVQDIFYDLEFALASIISHDDYALGIRSRNTDEIQQMVEESRQ